jgi:succinoglycan biosynthesis protein ExoM
MTATEAAADCSETVPAPRVVVCIATFRRPDKLARLLRSLMQQRVDFTYKILVADNCPEDPGVELAIREAGNPSVDWFFVHEPGVAIVRNELVRTTLTRYPDAIWAAFVDDDQIVAGDDWLACLVAAAQRYETEFVGGPVVNVLPEKPSVWGLASFMGRPYRRQTGIVATLETTGNLLIATSFFRRLSRPPFDPEFGRSGGEDYELFCLAKRSGARFAWDNAAIVTEAIEPKRASFRCLASRYFAVGAYLARIDARYFSPARQLKRLIGVLARSGLSVGQAVIPGRTGVELAKAVLLLTLAAGRIAGKFGWTPRRYGSLSGSKERKKTGCAPVSGDPKLRT